MESSSKMSHDEMVEWTKTCIQSLFKSDSLMSDLPSDIINEEVLSLIAVEHGQSITVNIARDAEPVLKVIVPQDVKVLGLKKAIARHFELYQNRTNDKTKISWKYIWKTYSLSYDGILLDDNESKISDYGVSNKATLKFSKAKNNRKKFDIR